MGDSRVDFLSKEAVSGELLSDRLARGSLSPADTLRYAIEIGSALHKAHSRGLVHGGLSPSSIGLTTGSARILEATSCPEEHAAYRAPELLRGEEPDPCSDVFAYGALLYEMASGRRAFPGEGAELNQQILTQAPEPLTKSTTSSAMEAVIAGCLDKDRARRQRVQNAVTELKLAGRQPPLTGEAARSPSVRRAIERVSSDSSAASLTGSLTGTVAAVQDAGAVLSAATPTDTPTRVAARRRVYRLSFKPRAWAIVGGLLAVVAISVGATMFLRPKPAPPVLKFAVIQPENTSYPGMPSVSPDGRYLAFSAVGQEGKRMLWLRPLDALRATVVQGSEGASAPFWSPDSQAFAFFGGKSLKKVKITGGTPENICAAEASPGGGAWNTNGTILFAPGLSDGLYRVPASGGKPQLVLKLDESKAERADLWPQFLPDGKHFVFYQQTDFTETSGVYVGSMDQPEYHRLFTSQTNAVYSAAPTDTPKIGYLLYIHEGNLMAQQFNTSRLELAHDPITLANEVGAVRSLSLAPISVSATGVLVYQGVGQPTRQMVWMDRSGRQLSVAGLPGTWGPPRISPDGSRAVAAKTGNDGRTAHLWMLNVSGAAEQITDGPMHEGSPVWSPDGSRIAYFGKQGEAYDIFVRGVMAGSKAELLLKSPGKKFPSDWSHDGRYITYSVEGAGTRLDLWGLALSDRRVAPILDTVYAEGFATISPNGKWIAYQSAQSNRNEVYVQTFDGLNNGTKRRWLVSKGGGLPRWRYDSGELFYMTFDGRVMSVSIHLGSDGGIEPGEPQTLFQTRPVPKTWNLYDVTADGQRFSVNIPLGVDEHGPHHGAH